MTVPPVLLRRILVRLRRLGVDRARRVEGVALLRTLPGAAPVLGRMALAPLLAVPFTVADRDAARAALERRLVPTPYVFDPPLDDYAGGLVEASPDPAAARWWAAHALPVDPLHAARALPVVAGLTPAPGIVPRAEAGR
jgi:hypothetical protein